MILPQTKRPIDVKAIEELVRTKPAILKDMEEDVYGLCDPMGESYFHAFLSQILVMCIEAHLRQTRFRCFADLNLYYSPTLPTLCVSPDLMVVAPTQPQTGDVTSYRVGRDGPVPELVIEILSPRTATDRDLDAKLVLYASLGIAEYVLIDPAGRFLPQRLLLKRLLPDGSWRDERDEDGGVSSQLGFRLHLEADGLIGVYDTATGTRYIRPNEGQAEAEARRQAEKEREQAEIARQQAEARVRELEAELARLRQQGPKSKP